MLIIPAIDLHQGESVRLLQGRFDAVTRFGDPAPQLAGFAKAGATWAHMVDLDGARQKAPVHSTLIAKLIANTPLKIQSGGGVREQAHIETLLDAGVSRVVVGSVAVRDPTRAREWLLAYDPERICLAFDVNRIGDTWRVAADGWATDGGVTLEDALKEFPVGTLRHALVTDISRDGALKGPNVALARELKVLRPDVAFQASGGVSRLSDLTALREAGADAVIIGRALHEGRFTLEDALAL